MIVYTATGERLTIKDVPFSKGGEGAVFQIPSNPQYCVKIYHPEKRNADRKRKLEYMVLHPPISSNNKTIYNLLANKGYL